MELHTEDTEVARRKAESGRLLELLEVIDARCRYIKRLS